MKKKILLLLFIFLFSCKDEIIIKEFPTVNIEISWLGGNTYTLTGETFEPCDRGFIIAGYAGSKIGDVGVIILPYDVQGNGRYSKTISLTNQGAKYYIKAWATRSKVEYTGYSREESIQTW